MSNELELSQSRELTLGNDDIIYIAEQAEKRVAAINTIMKAALKMTTHLDWVNIGGNPYLQETGASKIARLMGVSWQIEPPFKVYDEDKSGHYSYRTKGSFIFAGAEITANGLRSTRDDFFSSTGKDKPPKQPQDINERDVMQAAYVNCLNRGIKTIIPGLRNITTEHLTKAGIDVSKLKGYGFNKANQAEMSDDAKNQKDEIISILKKVYGDRWASVGLKSATEFTGRDGSLVEGKTDINKLSEKQIGVTYKKVKANYERWLKENADKANDRTESAASSKGKD